MGIPSADCDLCAIDGTLSQCIWCLVLINKEMYQCCIMHICLYKNNYITTTKTGARSFCERDRIRRNKFNGLNCCHS